MTEEEKTAKGGLQRSLVDETVVEEVLGHLYAKPPITESLLENQISGINGLVLENLKRSASPNVNASNKKIANKPKSNISTIFNASALIGNFNNEINSETLVKPGDSSGYIELSGLDKVNFNSLCSPALPLGSGIKKENTSKATAANKLLPLEANNVHSIMSDRSQPAPGHNATAQLQSGENYKKNKKISLSSKSKSKSSSAKLKKKGTSSSESGKSELSGSDSSSSSSESSSPESEQEEEDQGGEAEEQLRQIQIAQLKEKQKELREKVRKLKQSNQEASITKHTKGQQPMTLPKSSSACPSPTNSSKSADNNLIVPSPSPAYSGIPPVISSTPLSQPIPPLPEESVPATTMQQTETSDVSMPLDLCVKKPDSSPGLSVPQPLALITQTLVSTSTPVSHNSATSTNARPNVSAIQSSPSRRRVRKAKPGTPTSLNNTDNRGSRRKPQNDVSLSHSHGGTESSFDLSAMDMSGTASSNGRTSGQMLLLPSPFGTCDSLRIPDLTSRVNASLLSNLSQKSDLDITISSRKQQRSAVSSSKTNESVSIRSIDGSTSSRLGESQTIDNRSAPLDVNIDQRRLTNSVKELDGNLERNNDILDSNSSSDSESSMDSGSDSNSSVNTAASTTSSTHTSAGVKRHRHDRSDPNAKRKRVQPDYKELRIPLEHGWRRQTRIRCFSRSGVRGEVVYYSPCGKKLRNYPEVLRYLQKNGITDIVRDNFSFSSKVSIGEFIERLPGGGPEASLLQNCVMINEQEVVARIEEVRARKGVLGVQNRNKAHTSSSGSGHVSAAVSTVSNIQSKHKELEDKQKKWEEIQMHRRLEQQAIARQNQELKALRRSDHGQTVREAKRQRVFNLAVDELKKQKDLQKMMKHQEKVEKSEHQRIEKELRNQQILEDREIKRQQSVLLREQEMQKRREMLLMVDLERERRRQHMMLVRALESRKKMEERDKKQKELIHEKEMHRLKKLEQRRIEMQLIREIKKPVDDMMLKDTVPLPSLNRIPGLKISSRAYGDLLMVYEFLHNFGETLGFDMENLPSLSTLQLALLNYDEKNEEELLSVVHHLLVCAIDDPGVSHPRSALTVLGQTLREVDITSTNVSEVLRLYIKAVNKHCDMCLWLAEKPFLSLNATKKAAILAFLCNELLCSKTVTRQVDASIDTVNALKKDKWVVEGQLRRLKAVLQRRKTLAQAAENAGKDETAKGKDEDVDAKLGAAGTSGKCKTSGKPLINKDIEEDDDLEDGVIDSGNESDETQETGQPSDAEDEEPEISNEELEKKIEKLTRQQNQFQNKLLKSSNTLRGTTLGQDRFRRRYWILPKLGGIFVESLESAEILQTEEFPLETLEMREIAELKEKEADELKEEQKIDEDEKNSDETEENKTELSKLLKEEVNESEKVEKDVVEEELTNVVIKEEIDSKSVIEEPLVDQNEKIPPPNKEDEAAEEGLKKASSTGHDPLDFTRKKISEHMKSGEEVKKTSKSSSKIKEFELKSDKDDFSIVKKEIESKDNSTKASKGSNSSVILPPGVDDKNNWLLHSPLFASILTGSLLMNGPLLHGRELNGSYLSGNHAPKGASGTSASHAAAAVAAAAAATSEVAFNPFMGLPSDFVTAEQIMKHFTDPSQTQQPQQKNWFSILPKTPCDPMSLAALPGLAKPLTSGITKPKVFTKPEPTQDSIIPATKASASAALPSPTKSSPANPASSLTTNKGTNKPASNPSSSSAADTSSPNISHPLGLMPPEATNKITASALANLQLGLLNGIPPGILMHSFMAAHGIGPLYQAGGNNPMGVINALQTPEPLQLAQETPTPVVSEKLQNTLGEKNASDGCSTPTGFSLEGGDNVGSQLDHPKRAMVERMQHDKPLPIPLELQRGWWRITDMSQLKALMAALHHRGIREKIFQKYLEKYLSFTTSICSSKENEGMDLEIIELDRLISANLGGAPEPDSEDHWLPDVALKVDLTILEQVENLEDKIAGASMQIKQDIVNHPEQGWKIPPKLTGDKAYLFQPACTFEMNSQIQKQPAKIEEVEVEAIDECVSKDKDSTDEEHPQYMESCDPDETVLEDDALIINEDIDEETKMDVDVDVAIEIVPNVKQTRKSKDASPVSTMDDEDENDNEIEDEYLPGILMNPVEVAKKRLLKVESVIERRYIRPPLGTSTELNLGNLSSSATTSTAYGPDEITPGLIKWRRAVENCFTSSQLALCINLLENSIAWDKSIMRASCQFCHSGDNEEMLLLCDGCDKGYHTYCFKPKMENIPDGDWYCYECLNKATGDKVCIMCGKKGNKLLECEGCPKTFHMSCLDPPIAKAPKGKWSCPGCNHKTPKKSSGGSKSKQVNKDKEKKEEKEPKEEKKKVETPASSSKATNKEKKEKNLKAQISKDLTAATIIISELECHEDAWPFLLPVNIKQFPTYRKVIKKSMDVSTMRSKLESGTYKSRDDFANDARLIFDNCETFNEDDSPVGIAGHNMRAFFECRWSELCST